MTPLLCPAVVGGPPPTHDIGAARPPRPQLWFPLPPVVVLAQHAIASPEQTGTSPGLLLGVGDGVGLMSGGLPAMPRDGTDLVFAVGLAPGSDPAWAREAAGDQPLLAVPLLARCTEHAPTLIERFRSAHERQWAWFVIELEPARIVTGFREQ